MYSKVRNKLVDAHARKMHVKTGDTVVVLSGNDRGKQGKIKAVSRKEGKVIVEGVHIVTKHVKPRTKGQEGGIVKVEGAIYASKVQLMCSHCGSRTRVAHKIMSDGTKKRSCKKCGEVL